VHKLTVTHTILSRRRVDARDPQTAKIALARTPVTVCIPQGLHHRLIGTPKQAMFRPTLALG
jgi:hypothetical protein